MWHTGALNQPNGTGGHGAPFRDAPGVTPQLVLADGNAHDMGGESDADSHFSLTFDSDSDSMDESMFALAMSTAARAGASATVDVVHA